MSHNTLENLFNIIKNKDIVGLKKIIASGVDVNQKDEWGITLLMEICYYIKSPEIIVKIFLENGANANAVDKWGRDALNYAKRARYPHSKEEMIGLKNLLKSYKK